LGVDGSSVVTSIYGRAGHEVQEVMRELGQGKLDPPVSGQFGYVPLGENFPESLKQDLDALLSGLLNGYVQTNVPFEKP
jgi:hypothetical protein